MKHVFEEEEWEGGEEKKAQINKLKWEGEG